MTFFIKKISLSKSGFSLMEMMVVIAIIGITAGFAIPNYIATRDDRKLKSVARELLGDMHKTRMGAIKDNQNWSISFFANGYQISDSVPTVRKTVTFTDRYNGIIYDQGDATASITGAFTADFISYTGNILTFNSSGTCSSGYVYLANTNGTVFGVGTLSSGIVIFKQWVTSGWSS